MLRWVFAFAINARRISLPVESPCACKTRERLCAPSRVKASLLPSRSKCIPQLINCSIRSGPSLDQDSHRFFPAQTVTRE